MYNDNWEIFLIYVNEEVGSMIKNVKTNKTYANSKSLLSATIELNFRHNIEMVNLWFLAELSCKNDKR